MTLKAVLTYEKNILTFIKLPEYHSNLDYMTMEFKIKILDPRQAGEPLTMIYAMHKYFEFERHCN